MAYGGADLAIQQRGDRASFKSVDKFRLMEMAQFQVQVQDSKLWRNLWGE